MKHEPVMKCTTTQMVRGYLCTCGRTILGQVNCFYHFGQRSMEQLDKEVECRTQTTKTS